ncbi:hypothetical protein CTA1_6324 [Colletotrichum tanaceti]|uniref:Uncharacterized protein n=1 Tax=Colletotrichum tanaceti TaxID=1306861 RepID=A0A4U6X4N5_9PEZI|nr:hypothetical protein CTA1_6324 [Colletotrichum tanaceti]
MFSLLDLAPHSKAKSRTAAAYGGRDVPAVEPGVDDQVRALIDLVRTKYAKPAAAAAAAAAASATKGATRQHQHQHQHQHQQQQQQQQSLLDLGPLSCYFTMDVITRLAFGHEFGYLKQETDLYRFLGGVRDLWPRMSTCADVPWIRNFLFSPAFLKLIGPKSTDKSSFRALMSKMHNNRVNAHATHVASTSPSTTSSSSSKNNTSSSDQSVQRYEELVANRSGDLMFPELPGFLEAADKDRCGRCLYRDSYGAEGTHCFGGVQLCDDCRATWRAYLESFPERAARVFPEILAVRPELNDRISRKESRNDNVVMNIEETPQASYTLGRGSNGSCVPGDWKGTSKSTSAAKFDSLKDISRDVVVREPTARNMLKRATGLAEGSSLPLGAEHEIFKGHDGTRRFLTQANDFGMCRVPHQRFENGYVVAEVPHVRPWLELRVSEPDLSKHWVRWNQLLGHMDDVAAVVVNVQRPHLYVQMGESRLRGGA